MTGSDRQQPMPGDEEQYGHSRLEAATDGAVVTGFEMPEWAHRFEVTTNGDALYGWFKEVAAGRDPRELALEIVECAKEGHG